jgi:hypothetical protein
MVRKIFLPFKIRRGASGGCVTPLREIWGSIKRWVSQRGGISREVGVNREAGLGEGS